MAQVSSAADLRPAVVPLQAQVDIAPAAAARWRLAALNDTYKLVRGWGMMPEDCDDPCESIPLNHKCRPSGS